MYTPQHCPNFKSFNQLSSFKCRCPECGEDREIFSDEFEREQVCNKCGKKIDFTRCEVDASA